MTSRPACCILSNTKKYFLEIRRSTQVGRRGAPAKGVGRVTGARVQISPSPKRKSRVRGFFLFGRDLNIAPGTGAGVAASPPPGAGGGEAATVPRSKFCERTASKEFREPQTGGLAERRLRRMKRERDRCRGRNRAPLQGAWRFREPQTGGLAERLFSPRTNPPLPTAPVYAKIKS